MSIVLDSGALMNDSIILRLSILIEIRESIQIAHSIAHIVDVIVIKHHLILRVVIVEHSFYFLDFLSNLRIPILKYFWILGHLVDLLKIEYVVIITTL